MQTAMKQSLADTRSYRNHARDAKHRYENNIELTKYIRQFKCSNMNFSVEFSVKTKTLGVAVGLFVNFILYY